MKYGDPKSKVSPRKQMAMGKMNRYGAKAAVPKGKSGRKK